ncbi:MAG: hypothetical protein HWN69_02085 [Desulfobacterales bacterium]|nr:hypothetical protein [Desulfobacterales bacterium]
MDKILEMDNLTKSFDGLGPGHSDYFVGLRPGYVIEESVRKRSHLFRSEDEKGKDET